MVFGEKQTEIVLVAHGSRNSGWVETLTNWFESVKAQLQTKYPGHRMNVRFSFLEVSPPFYEEVLQELELETGANVLIVPFFLSESGHGGEDVPGIATECLPPGVQWSILSNEGWPEVLAGNIRRRLENLGAWPDVPVVICGYGASGQAAQWIELVFDIRDSMYFEGEGPAWRWAPCGHFLPEPTEPLRFALQEFSAAGHRQVAIIPLFLAISIYQIDLVPFVVAEFPALDVLYVPDAILPDPETENWAVERIGKWLESLNP